MGWLVGIDRIKRVQECLDYIKRRHNELTLQFPGADVRITSESKSDPGLKYNRDDWWGTCDVTIEVIGGDVIDTLLFLETIDYKDGRVWVDVENKPQLIGYYGGKVFACNTETAPPAGRITVVQPKTSQSVRYQDLTKGDFWCAIKKLSLAADATDDPDAPLIPGDHCTWCKHGRAKACTAASEKSLKEVSSIMENTSGTLFEIINETFGDIKAMSSAKLEELADAAPGLMEVFGRVNDELQRRVEDPDDNTVTGYAMLPGKASRDWAYDPDKTDEENEEIIAKALKGCRLKKDQIYPAKLITAPAALKLDALTDDQKKRIEKKYVKKTPGKKTLQKVRQSEKPDTQTMFMDVAEPKAVSFM
jgi:hypothetical protein